jgi:hypothetical protein
MPRYSWIRATCSSRPFVTRWEKTGNEPSCDLRCHLLDVETNAITNKYLLRMILKLALLPPRSLVQRI